MGSRMTIKEIKSELISLGVDIPSKAKKSSLFELLSQSRKTKPPAIVSPKDAELEKACIGGNLAVKHFAEVAPDQPKKAQPRFLFPGAVGSMATQKKTNEKSTPEKFKNSNTKRRLRQK